MENDQGIHIDRSGAEHRYEFGIAVSPPLEEAWSPSEDALYIFEFFSAGLYCQKWIEGVLF